MLGSSTNRHAQAGRKSNGVALALTVAVLLESFDLANANWNSMFSNSDGDYTHYAQSSMSEWLSSSSSIGIRVNGCAWSYVSNQDENAGCMENESEDGTTYWYMMANCRRANVVYDVYASDSNSISCGSSTFKESFVTTGGLSSFISIMNSYDAYSPFAYGGDDDSYGGYYEGLPMCEEDGSGYYVSVGCTDSGGFTIHQFADEYCLQPVGQSSELSSLNKIFSKQMNSCYDATTFASYLLPYSTTCSGVDSSLCTTSSRTSSTGKKSGSSSNTVASSGGGLMSSMTWANKMKYIMGSLLLMASLIMFMGILFTNRRKRRAMMHRKFRQRYGKDRSRSTRSRSSKSRSKSRLRSDGMSRSSRSRSKSKSRSKSRSRLSRSGEEESGGVGYFA